MIKFLLVFIFPLSVMANLNIAVTYPYIGAITKAVGGNSINTVVLAKGNWDPHFIIPKPSLITRVRNADGLIINGGQLEIGWLPPLIRRASNPKVNINAKTFLNLGHYIDFINKPMNVDRAQGDVHPDGNPHFHLDPKNIILLAQVIKQYLSSIDEKNANIYEKNYKEFAKQWIKNLVIWNTNMQNKKGMKVVQFHNNLAYFLQAYGLENIGTIEPLPGISPSSRHTLSLIKLMKKEKPVAILHDVYHSTKTAEYISSKTGTPVILMPHDIGSLDSVEDLASLFDYLTSSIK